MRRALYALALGTGLLAAVALGAIAAEIDQQAFSKMSVPVREEVLADHSILSFEIDEAVEPGGALHRLVLLPANAGEVSLELLSGQGDLAEAKFLGNLRGRPVFSVRVDNPAPGELELAIHHKGSWDRQAPSYSRDFDHVFGALVSGIDETAPRDGAAGGNGSYVIITAPQYVAAAQPLVDWKRQKGFNVVLATTSETGLENTAIQAWLRNAYNTWDAPPEYVLLLGDVDVLPAWSFSENVSDHPYSLMDEGDWLPDLHLGRMSVEGDLEAQTLINKTVAYERDPYIEDTGWFTRSLMVAGNYGSTSPSTTVTWCGEQLETIGYEPASTVFFPPLFNGVFPITEAFEEGVSICAYRGWAYGPAGWEPPHFTVDNIPGVDNGAMTPVVMSFVCLNGNFENQTPCFGEVFTRQGTPTEPKGAVAFIGNGEHWSHTRYNDAMAIAYFEHIVDEGVTTLGQVAMAGKLTFMNYFPHQLEETGNEESVEFYLHIYNLLGDPELNFWKQAPEEMTANIDLNVVQEGSNYMVVETSVEGARLGVVQNDQLLGCGYADAGGTIYLPLTSPLESGEVQFTVTSPGYKPYIQLVNVGQLENHLTAIESDPASCIAGEELDFSLFLRNVGTEATNATTVEITADSDGFTIVDGSADLPALDPGASAWTESDFTIQVDHDLEDGSLIHFEYDAVGVDNYFGLTVNAPRLTVASINVQGDGLADPGETVDFVLDLSNVGGAGTNGGVATIQLNTPGGGIVDNGVVDFGAMPAGGGSSNAADPFVVTVSETAAQGSALNFTLLFDTVEGHQLTTSFAVVVGEMSVGSPVGPDNYGYYAYDSADIDYPAQVPIYNWVTLSPRYGGTGTELDFPSDKYPDQGETTLLVDLPFDFQYYGQSFDEIRVSDNGWISFDTHDFFDFYNWGMPNRHGNHSLVAPFWDNFVVDPREDEIPPDWEFRDGIYSQYVSAEGAYIVEWSMVRHYKPEIDDLQTFQLWILDPAVHGTGPMGDGEMLFQYKQVANLDYERNYATVGFESPSEDDGLQISYGNVYAEGSVPLSPGLAIRVSTEAPVYDPLTLAAARARPSGTGWKLDWTPSDNRPVTGWRLLRNGEVIATLPAGAREYEDAEGGENAEYRLVALHPFAQETDLGLLNPVLASLLSLDPASPNPTRAGAWIHFSLGQAGPAKLSVFDVSGRRVRELLQGEGMEGAQTLFWDGRDEAGRELASGVYFYRLQAGERSLTRKLVLIR